jgi:hypothetical protein
VGAAVPRAGSTGGRAAGSEVSFSVPPASAVARAVTAATAGRLTVTVRRRVPRATRITVSLDGRRVAVVRVPGGRARARAVARVGAGRHTVVLRRAAGGRGTMVLGVRVQAAAAGGSGSVAAPAATPAPVGAAAPAPAPATSATPAAQPASLTPAAVPAAQTPAAQTPPAQAPAAQTPPAQPPATAQTPAAQTPAGSAPAGATPPATPPTTPSVTPPDEIGVYVAPFGDDAAPGTAARPVATLSRALAIVPDRGVIRLAAGSYPAAYDQVRHAATVVVDARAATIAGLQFHGATHVTVVGGTFTGLVKIDANGLSRPSEELVIDGADLTGGCVNIRDKARAIVVRNSRMHDCWTGVSGPGRVSAAYQSSDILIEDNLIEDMQSDGIQFGDWNDVTITGNTIRDIRDPAGVIHNDGIQFTGGTTGVRIVGNRISVASSMILIQPAIRPIDDVLVQGNTLGPNFAVTVQSQGATRARFIGNTMCGGVLGGLWLRAASDGGAPTDTVVQDNVLSSYREMEGARAAVAERNVIGCP